MEAQGNQIARRWKLREITYSQVWKHIDQFCADQDFISLGQVLLAVGIDSKNIDGFTALLSCVRHGQLEAVKYLAFYANLNVRTADGFDALMVAAIYDQPNI